MGYLSSLLIVMCALVCSPISNAKVSGGAPGGPGIDHSWTNGDKEGVGTAYESYDANGGFSSSSSTAPISKVWFTIGDGILNEVYYPSVDKAQIRDHQLIITDGKSFMVEEKDMTDYTLKMEENAPIYHLRRHDGQGRFSIFKTFVADPDSSAIVVHTRIVTKIAGLQFFILQNAAAGNTGWNDSAYVRGQNLVAGEANHWQAISTNVGFSTMSVGFVGVNDGWNDLNHDRIHNQLYQSAERGNVALTGRLNTPPEPTEFSFITAIGFGANEQEAISTANAVQKDNKSTTIVSKYRSQWTSYISGLDTEFDTLSSDNGSLVRASAMVLKIGEDHTVPGAVVAAMAYPWGDGVSENNNGEWDREKGVTGYHLVWPRDLYQVATGFMALGDHASARSCLRFLKKIQYQGGVWRDRSSEYSKKGSFPQNVWTNGVNHWRGLQMDQTAFPVMLAYKLWKKGEIQISEFRNMITLASDFIYNYGPWSQQERWEENFGISPSNIAAQASALLLGAEIFEALGDTTRANSYRIRADEWVKPSPFNSPTGVDAWLYTTTGTWGDGNYYLRLDGASGHHAAWDPNDNAQVEIKNHGGYKLEKSVLGSGFLELVRYGLRSPLSTRILSTIDVYDQKVRKNIAIGPGYYRYMYDGYGENHKGRLWPLLTGERGYYQLRNYLAKSNGNLNHHMVSDLMSYVRFFEKSSSATKMIPEQVWDEGKNEGKGTGSATPLNWSHAEYIKLMKAIYDRKDIETFEVIKNRYGAHIQN